MTDMRKTHISTWAVYARMAISIAFLASMCFICSTVALLRFFPGHEYIFWLGVALMTAFLILMVEQIFVEWAKHRMEMFVIADWSLGGGMARTTYVKVGRSEFFVPRGQELIIRRTEDGKSLEIFVDSSQQTPTV